MAMREPEKFNPTGYWVYSAIVIVVMAAQTFLCVYAL